jgi:hypothetical protein
VPQLPFTRGVSDAGQLGPKRTGTADFAIKPGIALLEQFSGAAAEFQTVIHPASEGPFRRPFSAIHPSVDDFGTLTWPNREEIESLLIVL